MILAVLAVADAPSLSLLDLGLGSALALAGVAVAVVGWVVAQNTRINAKADAAALTTAIKALEAAVSAVRDEAKAALLAVQDDHRSRCSACRRDLDEKLERKASKSEVVAHASLLSEQGKGLAVIQSELAGLGKRFDELRDMVRQLLDREH